ncbi:hypothetical protein CLAIMM_10290 isoform 2, partial [Cladophialophora immunda]
LGLPSLITSFPPGCFDAVGLLSFSHGLLDLYPCSPSIMSDGLHTSGPLQSRREGARIQRRLLDATSTLCNHASFLLPLYRSGYHLRHVRLRVPGRRMESSDGILT